jgi:hypothetical protein
MGELNRSVKDVAERDQPLAGAGRHDVGRVTSAVSRRDDRNHTGGDLLTVLDEGSYPRKGLHKCVVRWRTHGSLAIQERSPFQVRQQVASVGKGLREISALGSRKRPASVVDVKVGERLCVYFAGIDP